MKQYLYLTLFQHQHMGLYDQAPSAHCPSPGSGGSADTIHFTRAKARRGNTEGKEEDIFIHKSVSRMDNLKPVKQHILWKKKAEMLQSRVNELEEENDLLKKQLEEKSAPEQDGNLEIMATGSEEPQAMILDSSTDTTSDSSTDSSSESSSISDSSDEEKKKKKRKKKNGKKKSKKRKKENKKVKKSNGKGERVASIADVVKRYRRVLKLVQRGFRMTAAFKKACVSRNAVKDTAAIAEIYIVDKSVLEQIKGKYTLLQLAQLCQKKIVGELAEKIIEMKTNKQLIPFSVRKD
ncbi:protein FAM133-like [Pseudorasbora parva]|uniref:protein FAM133-like n=1 Tax=Pseudorasbora parva TaxID=51549 RepID=UPI00351DAADB